MSPYNQVKRGKGNKTLKTVILGLMLIVMAAMLIAGPRFFNSSNENSESTVMLAQAETGGEAQVNTTEEAIVVDDGAALDNGAAVAGEEAATEEAAAEVAEAHGEAVPLPFGPSAWPALFVVLGAAIIAIAFGLYWYSKTMKVSPGSERMQGVAKAVQEGAYAYLLRQVKTMIVVVLVLGIGLAILYITQYQSLKLGLGVAIAFIAGVAASYAAGYIGMGVAVRANVRVANAALSSFKCALETAFQAGAVSGMFTVGLGLLGATVIFMIFQTNAMFVLVGFGFGGSLAALFMRVGGGIFTKAADVGADLVGKVEAGIPEDDPRNAATIADNVGDNVGDCAGMAADVFESYEVTLVAAIILAAAVGAVLQAAGYGNMMVAGTFSYDFTLSLVVYALLVRAVGVVASIIGVFAVRGKDDPNLNPMKPINTGLLTSSIVATLGFLIVAFFVFGYSFNSGKLTPKFDFAAEAAVAPQIYTEIQVNYEKTRQQQIEQMVGMYAGNGEVTREQIEELVNQRMPAMDIETSWADLKDGVKMLEKHIGGDVTYMGIMNLFQDEMARIQKENPGIDQSSYEFNAILQGDAVFNDINTAVSKIEPSISNANGIKQMDGLFQSASVKTALGDKMKNLFWLFAFAATFIGIILTQVIGKLTEYFTAEDKKPVTEISTSAKTGPATLILSGLSEGLESSVWSIVAIAGTIFLAFIMFPNPAFAAYAIALAGLGLLATTGYVLAMDTYGPISDNANGIFEMSGALKNDDGTENTEAHNIVARLDMVGNTTKALTKGFAIATAVIAAVALYRSFLDTVATEEPNILVNNIQVNLPDVFVGLLIGGAIPFLFSSFAIRAVSRAAVQLVEEVRYQFKTIPGIWNYTGVGEEGKPDYAKCVAIATAAAQKELIGPGILAVVAPMFVGFWIGPYALGGFLAGAILVGQLMAVFMSNTGGAWDNAKKKIEDGFLGGKGSEAHKAGVIGDTVGDPLKDTAGPALNPMIKVMNLVAILIGPATVVTAKSAAFNIGNVAVNWNYLIAILAMIVLVVAIMWSKRGGIELGASSDEAVAEAVEVVEEDNE